MRLHAPDFCLILIIVLLGMPLNYLSLALAEDIVPSQPDLIPKIVEEITITGDD